MRLSLLLITTLLALTACNKDETGSASYWDCNLAQETDSNIIASKLIGSWQWSKQHCGDGGGTTTTADKSIKVSFNADHTFTLRENSTILTQGSWSLSPVDSDFWGLNLSSFSEYLPGRIFFCDNKLLFNSRYLDGCDNVFRRSF